MAWLTELNDSDVHQDRVGDRLDQVLEWVNELGENEEYLSDQQVEFVAETRARLEEFGETARLTDKQYRWVRGLHERLEERLTNPRSYSRRRRGGRGR